MTYDRRKNGLVLDDGKITALKEFMTPDELYQMLIARVKKYHPSDDISMIEKPTRWQARHMKDSFESPASLTSSTLFMLPSFWQI